MATALEQEGVFRGRITAYGADEAESGAIAIVIEVLVEEIWAEGEWHDWREHEFMCRGHMWVVKKDGTVNKRQAEALMLCAGWDGTFRSVTDSTWEPKPIAFTVSADEYKGEVNHRINWINPYDYTPGGGGNVDAEKAKAIDSKLSSQLRALNANTSRNDKKPATPPPVKKKSMT